MKQEHDDEEDEILVVAAPTESAPGSPGPQEHLDEFFGHGEGTLQKQEPWRDDSRSELPLRSWSAGGSLTTAVTETTDGRAQLIERPYDVE